jgi:hypothetical protein
MLAKDPILRAAEEALRAKRMRHVPCREGQSGRSIVWWLREGVQGYSELDFNLPPRDANFIDDEAQVAAGISKRLWDIGDIVTVIENWEAGQQIWQR